MTSSILAREPISFGSKSGVRCRLDITSYSTGGETMAPALLGLESGSVPHVLGAIATEEDDVHFVHDRANNKLKAIVSSTGAEVAGAVDLGEVELTVMTG